jgi:hypothetical protein
LAALRWVDVAGDRLAISGQITAMPGPTKSGPPVLERRPTKSRQVRTVTLDVGTRATIEAWRAVHDGWVRGWSPRHPCPAKGEVVESPDLACRDLPFGTALAARRRIG